MGSLTVALVVLATSAAHAERPKPPCRGCTIDLPAKLPDAVPLLVVLHGDRERAEVAATRWRRAARARGWAVLALQCPKDQGCNDSWWQWNGDPAWVREQIVKLASTVAIDPTRIAIAGWSGGGSYLGQRAKTWPEWASGIVIHGGGMAPIEEGCPARALPGYFLVGDRNPLHRLAEDLRAYFEACKHEVHWDLVRGGGHDREAGALDLRKASAILDWLHARPLTPTK